MTIGEKLVTRCKYRIRPNRFSKQRSCRRTSTTIWITCPKTPTPPTTTNTYPSAASRTKLLGPESDHANSGQHWAFCEKISWIVIDCCCVGTRPWYKTLVQTLATDRQTLINLLQLSETDHGLFLELTPELANVIHLQTYLPTAKYKIKHRWG